MRGSRRGRIPSRQWIDFSFDILQFTDRFRPAIQKQYFQALSDREEGAGRQVLCVRRWVRRLLGGRVERAQRSRSLSPQADFAMGLDLDEKLPEVSLGALSRRNPQAKIESGKIMPEGSRAQSHAISLEESIF